jgi:hypothetical protein
MVSFSDLERGTDTFAELASRRQVLRRLAALGLVAAGAGATTSLDAAAKKPRLRTLKLFYDPVREDNFSTATAEGTKDAEGAGYVLVRNEGRIHKNEGKGLTPLKLFWHPGRGDNFVTATAAGEQDAKDAGYVFVRVEGFVAKKKAKGLVPLKTFWSDARQDNFATATEEGEEAALAAGYRLVRTEGFVHPAT